MAGIAGLSLIKKGLGLHLFAALQPSGGHSARDHLCVFKGAQVFCHLTRLFLRDGDMLIRLQAECVIFGIMNIFRLCEPLLQPFLSVLVACIG